MADLTERLGKLRDYAVHDHFHNIALIDESQFTNPDIEAATFVSSTQLHNWVSRDWIKLSGGNPGRGKRRLYTGMDAVAVAVAAALQPFGMMQVADQLIRMNQIPGRTLRLLTDPTCIPDYGLGIVPFPEQNDWLYIPMGTEAAETELPSYSLVVLDVDTLIVETLERIVCILEGKPIAPRVLPKRPTQQETEDQALEFFGAAYRDAEGNRIYRGLTADESKDWDDLKARYLTEHLEPSDETRSDDYFKRNSKARHQYLAETLGDRLAKAGLTGD
jgi:hypothetical protein